MLQLWSGHVTRPGEADSPVRTALAEGSARSRADFPSVFRMFGSAPCCSSTETGSTIYHVTGITLNPRQQQVVAAASLTNADINLALNGSFMQRCVVPVVPGVWVGTLTQQQADHLGMTEGAGVVQGDETAIVPGMDIGACLQQMLHYVLPAKA